MIDPKRWPELSRLLDEALDIPPGQRDQWLDALPATDSVHKEELRTLLRHDASAETRDILINLPNVQKAAARARAALRAMPFSPGSTVGPYVIEKELGSGGMGAVWVAHHLIGVRKPPRGQACLAASRDGVRLAERQGVLRRKSCRNAEG